jgi:hypothetical protein
MEEKEEEGRGNGGEEASRLKSTVPITRPISQLVTPKSFYAVRKSNQFHYIFTGAYSVPESLGGW